MIYFEAQVSKQKQSDISDVYFLVGTLPVWRPPKRCGWLTVQGQETLGRFVVDRILRWDDIVDGDLTMVSYWPKHGDKFKAEWI